MKKKTIVFVTIAVFMTLLLSFFCRERVSEADRCGIIRLFSIREWE